MMAWRAAGSAVGRYMMMPTQECSASAGQPRAAEAGQDAGLMGAELAALQRCSMGECAGMPCASMMPISSVMKFKSAPEGRLHGMHANSHHRSVMLYAACMRRTVVLQGMAVCACNTRAQTVATGVSSCTPHT